MTIEAKPKGGTIYAHLFENPTAGVPRDLYWNLSIDAELSDFEEDTSILIEWLRFAPATRPLEDRVTCSPESQPLAEASFYIHTHEWTDLWSIELSPTKGRALKALVEAEADLTLDDGSTDMLHLAGEVALTVQGIILVKDNLPEKPASLDEALTLVAPFAGAHQFHVADEGWRFVLLPIGAE